jgi:hypothetical protein
MPVERHKRPRSRIESTTGMERYDGRTGIKESKGKIARRRCEAILVKVG